MRADLGKLFSLQQVLRQEPDFDYFPALKDPELSELEPASLDSATMGHPALR
jgi:hypothetical protein